MRRRREPIADAILLADAVPRETTNALPELSAEPEAEAVPDEETIPVPKPIMTVLAWP